MVDGGPGNIIGIEVKGTKTTSEKDFKGLIALSEDVPLKMKIVVCLCERPRKTEDGVEVLPVELFFSRLWKKEFF